MFRYSVRMWENVDQNNSEYGHFSRSDICNISIVSYMVVNFITRYVFFCNSTFQRACNVPVKN